MASPVWAGGAFVVPEGLTEVQRARFERFKDFQIKGVCNDHDLDRLATRGVNSVRGYTITTPEEMKAKLDHAQRLGMKMILSEWMPHHGENKPASGKFTFDYNAKEEEMLAKFIAKIEGIGDHPAILMWGLGNEVHLDEPYLRVVNRMSKAIHERFPHHITSLTMINAKPEAIEAVKKYAPDIDVLGVQCYSRGAVRGSIKNTEKHWGKPFYMSEFNTNGPWNFGKTAWGVTFDEPVSNKIRDLKDCYAAIDESPLCLGSTIFVWGHARVYRPTYFGLLLEPDPKTITKKGEPLDHLYITAQADVMTEHFTGKPIAGNRAPVITQIAFAEGDKSRLAAPGEKMRVNLAAEDSNSDPIEYHIWILDSAQRSPPVVAGPYKQTAGDHALIPAPEKPGEYLVLVYAVDGKGGASGSTLPFKVPAAEAVPAAK
jgi:hypothetical protein